MRSKRQKLLNTFVSVGSEANHHCWRDQFVGTVKNRGIFFLFFLIFFSACFAGGVCESLAAIYYVKNGGNDKLAGTSDATAWARCPGMAGWSGTASLAPGDVVYFREGSTWTSAARPILATKAGVTYYGKGYGSLGVRAKLKAYGTPSGTPSSGVIDIYASNVTVKGFEVDANEQSIGGIYIGYAAGYIDVTDVVVDDCVVHDTGGEEAVPTEYLYGILVGQRNLHTTRNITITNCEVYNTGHEGIAIYPSRNYGNFVENVTVRGCTIHDTGHWGGTSWGHGIYIALHTSNILIEYNTVYNTYSVGVVTYADHPTTAPYTVGYPDNVTIRYNLVYNSLNQVGITLNSQNNSWTGWGNVYIYGNVLYNNRLHIGGGNFWNKEIKIYNNTIYNNILNSKGIWIYKTASNTSGIEIKNNLIQTGEGTAAICLDDEGALLAENLHSNNLYYRLSGTLVLNGATYYTGSNINTWEGTAQNADPLFTGGVLPTGFIAASGGGMIPNTDFFNISSGNAINNGVTLGVPYDGCVNWTGSEEVACRPAGAYDIGAYEIPTVVNSVPRIKISKLK
jgi:hypothetical protein